MFFQYSADYVPVQSLANLGGMRLTGRVAGNTDTVSLTVASGDVYAQNDASIVNLGQGWTSAEYNLVGDCCAFGAYFTVPPTTLKVRITIVNGTQSAPTCSTFASGATAETNNLTLTGGCAAVGGAQPAITFTETGGGTLPPGITQGDTHIMTFTGIAYDVQETGEFTLVESGPDLIVQARQDYLGGNTAVTWNTAIAVKMGSSSVIVYPNSTLMVNLAPAALADGASLSLGAGTTIARKGNLFTLANAQGDIVQAVAYGNHLDASVQLSPLAATTARGLLARPYGDSTSRGGVHLGGALTAMSFHNFITSWRADPSRSLFAASGRPSLSRVIPSKPRFAAGVQERARQICRTAGVTNEILLENCTLDVAVTGSPASADTFVWAPKPRHRLRVVPDR